MLLSLASTILKSKSRCAAGSNFVPWPAVPSAAILLWTPSRIENMNTGQMESLNCRAYSQAFPVQPGTKLPHFRERLPDRKQRNQEHTNLIFGRRLPRPNFRRLEELRKIRAVQAAAGVKPQLLKQDLWEQDALSLVSGLQTLFLGTGTGDPREQRRTGSFALKMKGTTWLFDCGEDTQRQVHKQPLIRNGKVDRIFITSRRASNILGLPGMLCTMSGAREKGLDTADVPLHIYGPPGIAEYIGHMLRLSDTFMSMPIMVHEFVDHAVHENQQKPQQIGRRSSLYKILVPPDKLNPEGFFDGRIVPFLSRGIQKTAKMAKGTDKRLNYRDIELPPPGDRSAQLSQEDLQWTILTNDEQKITAYKAPASTDAWAFVWQEADRVGKMDPDRCDELRVNPQERGLLKNGQSVTSMDGRTIYPSQVIGEDIPGRKLAIIGESNNSTGLLRHVEQSDLIVHAASCQEENAEGATEYRACMHQAAQLTRLSKSHHLVLYKFKPNSSPAEGFEDSNTDNISSNGSLAVLSKEQEVLNSSKEIKMLKRPLFGGYLQVSIAAKQSAPGPAHVVKAVQSYVESIIGREDCVSIADDMDLFSLGQNVPAKKTADLDWDERTSQQVLTA